MSSQFKTVTIAGGTGNLGYHIAEAFLNDGSYDVKILRRKPKTENEKAKLLASKGAEIVYADYDQKDDLVNVLKGTDVVISTLSDSNANLYDSQTPLLAAAKEASVKRFIPSEFGFEYKVGVHQITDGKIRFEEEVIKSGLEYTIIYNGLFQEFLGWIGFDVKNKKATFYADGNKKLHTTSLSDVGKYTVETLKMPEARNSFIKVAGVTLSLNEYLQKFEEISGSKWEVVEDKEIKHRYQNKIDPIPSFEENFKATLVQNEQFKDLNNDKFSFTPRPVTEVIEKLVKQAA
ncbi:uncharacterized protein OCT59_020075 [Rhizophagus irregularis]|uniref:NmrA-like domain-containing protein n=2 Tax=Rhizophagus irregularis TaxID=588596 RepID=A0A015LBT6_RHIIW|nr:hypothetical protein GLOIN_2v1616904 [Rhizophagus irregularis DAOM 181602=DAOM 197198]EXX52278.1 hypothetical protein RirG_254380 [Rhizophagus irregularis DAOM 197198w]UZO01562.1 hypothetical protein OCT59_020075 [Rhizophagus irregularis]POG70343.1 hypothetical protein GLOIN_2v1616904 [Rhizophagus irregularis DAOM 181602=DAOM 197198]CAG8721282.1 1610_t:CDS:2 [Rhizophagus irregularis]GBC25690.1 aromatic alcohol reductase [Rhizophagus irregularis DAOM 181602=DAOM 197198]|eukprot:XP_025177209.1 hypothetical protein GLOIN_2v1616904 [Rhizophagus irregularis DAOM 181602=DAOM 197198]